MLFRKRFVSICLSLCTVLFLVGCAQPAATTSNSSGSLTLNIASVATWLRAAGVGSSTSVQGGRAILYATSVKVYITNSSGNNVIPPVTQTLSMTSAGTSGTALSAITGIPIGSNYKVSVYVYNSAYSTTSYVVSGSTTGVSIQENTATSVDVVCLPSSTTSLTANIVYTSSLDAYDEVWKSVTAVAGIPYTFNPPSSTSINLFVFDSAGEFLADASTTAFSVTPTVDTTYYVGLATGSTSVSGFNYSVSGIFPAANEGSILNPVPITLDANHTFVIGTSTNSDQYSYYTFTTGTAGYYYLNFTSTSIYYSFILGTSSDFSSYSNSGSYLSSGYGLSNLTASTQYYLRIQNLNTSSNISTTGIVISPEELAVLSRNEGSLTAPELLTVGAARSCLVGTDAYDSSSYYYFVAGTQAQHSLSVGTLSGSLLSASISVYSDATYAVSVGSRSSMGSDSILRLYGLTAGQTYYVKLTKASFSGTTQPIVPLTITNDTPAYTTLALSESYTPGTFSDSTGFGYYQVAVSPSTTYNIGWDDGWSGSGTYTCDVKVSAYNDDLVSYFVNNDAAYSSPVLVTTASDQTVLYICVLPYGSGDSGTFGIRCYAPSVGSLSVNVR